MTSNVVANSTGSFGSIWTISAGATNLMPLYATVPYAAPGAISGDLVFRDMPGVSDCDAILTWTKPAQTSDTIFQNGFSIIPSTIGSRGGFRGSPGPIESRLASC